MSIFQTEDISFSVKGVEKDNPMAIFNLIMCESGHTAPVNIIYDQGINLDNSYARQVTKNPNKFYMILGLHAAMVLMVRCTVCPRISDSYYIVSY